MAIELVVFDMAGTTINDEDGVGRCLRAALAEDGLQVTIEDSNSVMGIPKPEAIRLLINRSDFPDLLLPRADVIHDRFVERMIDFYRTDPSVREIPGATDMFRLLREAGIKVALDTGFGRKIVDTLLERLGWDEQTLDATITSDEVPRGRPYPDMINALCDRLGVAEPSSVAKVGDTPSDLEQGTASGCSVVVGVTWGTHTREQLAAHPHTHIIDRFAELPGLLGLRTVNGSGVA